MKTATHENGVSRPHDVFISYSRKDKEFVHRLDGALTARAIDEEKKKPRILQRLEKLPPGREVPNPYDRAH